VFSIFLSVVAAIMSLSQNDDPTATVVLLAGMIMAVTAGINSLQTYLRLDRQAHKHQSAASVYQGLYDEVQQYLLKEVALRQAPASFFAHLYKRLQAQIKVVPQVPEFIHAKYVKRVETKIDPFAPIISTSPPGSGPAPVSQDLEAGEEKTRDRQLAVPATDPENPAASAGSVTPTYTESYSTSTTPRRTEFELPLPQEPNDPIVRHVREDVMAKVSRSNQVATQNALSRLQSALGGKP